ncbi:MAG: RNA polymerase sigma factor region1.1 domain-containing protein, partial [Gallionella sp.]
MTAPKDKKKIVKKPLVEQPVVDPQQDLEARRTRLKALIVLGKERGYLTYAEINDHLPDMLEAEQIEGVASMINDMGIKVFDVAPDAEAMIMTDAAPAVADEDAAAEAEAALTTVDSEFGRTTDPVRMYMREMGTVDLLTREKEIEIAKRIEDGLKHMIQAISACPATIAEILALAGKIERNELKADDLIDGFVDREAEAAEALAAANAEAAAQAAAHEGEAEEQTEEEEEVDEAANAAAAAANLAQLRADALERFAEIATQFSKMGKAYEKYGYRSKQYDKCQLEIS